MATSTFKLKIQRASILIGNDIIVRNSKLADVVARGAHLFVVRLEPGLR